MNAGDIVQLNEVVIENRSVFSRYFTEDSGIPDKYLIHGRCCSLNGTGTIVDFYKEYVIVSFIDNIYNTTQLGFKKEDLTIITPINKIYECW